tara:strand:- start:298 stop:771 length:474 start_codon:yes stop_codon:yes gene_type:complete
MSNHIKKFTQKQKDAAKLGAEGGLGLIAGTIGRLGRTFGNAAKQYLRAIKKKPAINQQTARNIKPFHRDGRVYDRAAINDAFKKRFSKGAVPNKEILTKNKPSAKDMGLTDASKINREAPDPSQWTNFGRPDATVKMKDVMKKSGQYPKSDPFRGGK